MSGVQTGQASQRKPSTNKNIKKLRTISMVCSLTSSWQQWVAENETKQASEPSGWSPSSLGGAPDEPKTKWEPKKLPPTQTKPRAVEAHASSPQDAPKTEEVKISDEPLVGSRIKTKQVVKTVTSGVQEKSAGIELLAEKIKKETLPSGEEIDKLLKKKSSPTRRRKCSNMVASLTKSWKQVEKEQKLGKEGKGPGEGRTSVTDTEDGSGEHLETEVERLDIEDAQSCRTSVSEEAEQNESDSDPRTTVRIKRPQVPV